jgi:hypothetical protein
MPCLEFPHSIINQIRTERRSSTVDCRVTKFMRQFRSPFVVLKTTLASFLFVFFSSFNPQEERGWHRQAHNIPLDDSDSPDAPDPALAAQ